MAVRFDNADDRLHYSASAPPSTFTITAWVHLSVDTDNFSTWLRLWDSGSSTVATWATDSNGTSGPNYYTGAGSISNATGLAAGAWRKVAITRTGSSGQAMVATTSGSTEVDSGTVSTATPAGITLGNRSPTDGTEPFNGRLAYVRVWDSVLSQTEIEAEWSSATPVKTSGLWADWPLATATDLTDTANSRTLTVHGTAAITTEDGPGAFGVTATGTGTAYDATVATSGGTTAAAGNASGTGTANNATVGVGASTGHAAGSGTANNATPAVTATAGHAAGTGTANDATVSTAAATTATAGNATGTGTANNAAPSVAPSPATATGTGTANTASVAIAPPAGHATGTGTANNASTSVAPGPSPATGTGTANDATVATSGGSVTATASTASGTGAAFDATVSTTSAATPGSWGPLLALVREARTYRPNPRPTACPNDGEPLQTVRSRLHCRFCGWEG